MIYSWSSNFTKKPQGQKSHAKNWYYMFEKGYLIQKLLQPVF